jgi:hypothetical protein
MLNYDTTWMTRDEIAAATYEAMRRLARLKHEWGRTDAATCATTIAHLDASERALATIDRVMGLPEAERHAAMAALASDASSPAATPRIQTADLVWPLVKGRRFGSWGTLAAIGAASLASDGWRFATRRVPRYLRSGRAGVPSHRA